MTINKIYTTYNTQQIFQANSQKVKSKKDANKTENSSSVQETGASSSSEVSLSQKAKELQQTEALLRTALDKLNEFDEVRNDKLIEVKEKIDNGFYFTKQFDEILSEKIISDDEIDATIQAKAEMQNYLDVLNSMNESESVDLEKVKLMKARIEDGYYDDPKVLEETADKILEFLT